MKPYLDNILTAVLTPMSWLYNGGVWVRNKLYDAGILKEKKYEIPIISVGNLTVGGTGKTPHVEYIAEKLSDRYNIAILSRGYKRKTKGYVLANSKSTPEQIGDEPLQIYNKLKHRVKVAVCENRNRGIEKLLETFPNINLILLDDAFQHRSVKPKISVLLMDHNHPITEDKMLPLGRLREPVHSMYRADMVVVTKCPEMMQPLDFRMIKKKLELMSFQKLYFSSIDYANIRPVFPEDKPYNVNLTSLYEDDGVLLVTGIANPRAFVNFFKNYPFKVRVLRFPDHHDFTKKDIIHIEKYFENMQGRHKIIITTEKDSVRLLHNPYFPQELKPYVFYLPVSVTMRHGIDGEDFIEALDNMIHYKFEA